MNNLKAVIFDLDGTILLNEQVYGQAFLAVLSNHGVDTSSLDKEKPHIPGIGMEANWEKFKRDFNLPEEVLVSTLIHETQDEYHKRLPEVIIRPGFFELLEQLQEEGIFLGLATSNDWWIVEDELEDFDLLKYFNATVTREEVINPKPEPDIFWMAAEKLGFDEAACVVIEDSTAGVTAAVEAGIKSVAVLGTHSTKEAFPDADLVVQDFTELNPELLDSLLLKDR